ncbi:MAG TPA: hypothetical protein PKY12_04350 [Catalimonadaceae bacterium]|nr:hypothetical protein [Catalimonadaceae bacterium]
MKTLIVALLSGVLSSCGVLHSVTSIEANKSFVLGQGKHGSYKARVKNVGSQPVEIFIQEMGNPALTSLGILKPGEENFYPVKSNTMVMLKNIGNSTAEMKLDVKGDTGLSMGYQ